MFYVNFSSSKAFSGWFQTWSHPFWSVKLEKRHESTWIGWGSRMLYQTTFSKWCSAKDYSTTCLASIDLSWYLKMKTNLGSWPGFRGRLIPFRTKMPYLSWDSLWSIKIVRMIIWVRSLQESSISTRLFDLHLASLQSLQKARVKVMKD